MNTRVYMLCKRVRRGIEYGQKPYGPWCRLRGDDTCISVAQMAVHHAMDALQQLHQDLADEKVRSQLLLQALAREKTRADTAELQLSLCQLDLSLMQVCVSVLNQRGRCGGRVFRQVTAIKRKVGGAEPVNAGSLASTWRMTKGAWTSPRSLPTT